MGISLGSITGIGEVATLINDTIGRFFPNKTEQEKAELSAAMLVMQSQMDVNKTEAASSSTFVAGWRPFIGWTCGGALFSQYILRPWVQWVCILIGHPVPELPGIDDQLWQLMGTMLGMGSLRTFEKIKGKA